MVFESATGNFETTGRILGKGYSTLGILQVSPLIEIKLQRLRLMLHFCTWRDEGGYT